MNTTLQIRVDPKIKEKARKAFLSAGLNISSGVNMYLARVANTGEVPHDMFTFDNLPSARKQEILKDMKHALKYGKRYASAEEAINEILGKKK
jgi:addiction module RelB/DinJ family antitoxin